MSQKKDFNFNFTVSEFTYEGYVRVQPDRNKSCPKVVINYLLKIYTDKKIRKRFSLKKESRRVCFKELTNSFENKPIITKENENLVNNILNKMRMNSHEFSLEEELEISSHLFKIIEKIKKEYDLVKKTYALV